MHFQMFVVGCRLHESQDVLSALLVKAIKEDGIRCPCIFGQFDFRIVDDDLAVILMHHCEVDSSLVAQGHHGVDFGGSSRRDVACQGAHDCEQGYRTSDRWRVGRLQPIELP